MKSSRRAYVAMNGLFTVDAEEMNGVFTVVSNPCRQCVCDGYNLPKAKVQSQKLKISVRIRNSIAMSFVIERKLESFKAHKGSQCP